MVSVAIYDIAAGKVLSGRAVIPTFATIAWAHDSAGYWAIGSGQTADGNGGLGVMYRKVGYDGPSIVELPGFGILTASSTDDRVALAIEGSVPHGGVFIKTDDEWRLWIEECPPRFQGKFFEDRFITRWYGDSSNGRVVSIPTSDAGDRSSWHEIVPEQNKPATWLNIIEGRVVVGYQDDSDMETRIFDPSGSHLTDVDLRGGMIPRSYAGHGDGVDPAPGGFSFLYDGFTIAPEFHVYRIEDNTLETHRYPGADLGPLVHTRMEAKRRTEPSSRSRSSTVPALTSAPRPPSSSPRTGTWA